MKIDSVKTRGRTIVVRGNFQREDLQRILDMANAGTLTPDCNEHKAAVQSTQSVSAEVDGR